MPPKSDKPKLYIPWELYFSGNEDNLKKADAECRQHGVVLLTDLRIAIQALGGNNAVKKDDNCNIMDKLVRKINKNIEDSSEPSKQREALLNYVSDYMYNPKKYPDQKSKPEVLFNPVISSKPVSGKAKEDKRESPRRAIEVPRAPSPVRPSKEIEKEEKKEEKKVEVKDDNIRALVSNMLQSDGRKKLLKEEILKKLKELNWDMFKTTSEYKIKRMERRDLLDALENLIALRATENVVEPQQEVVIGEENIQLPVAVIEGAAPSLAKPVQVAEEKG
jgi:hypothetical protein